VLRALKKKEAALDIGFAALSRNEL
jgi:hypothetical protein